MAEELNLLGWVKNEDDGSVTIVAEGNEANLKKLIKWVNTGPGSASVKELKINWEKAKGEKNFRIIY